MNEVHANIPGHVFGKKKSEDKSTYHKEAKNSNKYPVSYVLNIINAAKDFLIAPAKKHPLLTDLSPTNFHSLHVFFCIIGLCKYLRFPRSSDIPNFICTLG